MEGLRTFHLPFPLIVFIVLWLLAADYLVDYSYKDNHCFSPCGTDLLIRAVKGHPGRL